MKSYPYLLSLLLVLFAFACGEDDAVIEPPVPEPEVEPSSLQIGLLMHLPFDGNADDVSNNRYTGTVTGATVTSDRNGMANGAYSFDGVDDVINYGNITDLGLGGARTYTMAAWVKAEQLPDDQRSIIISKFNGGVRAGWYLGINNDGTSAAYRNVGPWATFGNNPMSWGEYHHVASIFDGQNLSVYVDGELDNSVVFGTHPDDRSTNVAVGGIYSQNELRTAFEGVIDEIRIYNRVLEPEELTWLAEH